MFVFFLIVLAVFAVMLIVGLTVGILFLLSLQKTLDRCRRRNRTMEPAQVWLCLIPLFNLAWIVRVVFAVGDSLRNEFDDRRLDRRGDFGKTIGVCWLATTYLGVAISVTPQFTDMPIQEMAWYLFRIAALALFIIYWIRIVGYRRQLERDGQRNPDRDDDLDDYRDDDYRDDEDDDRDFEAEDRPRLPLRPDDRIR